MKDDKKAANEAENKSAESATAETTENKTVKKSKNTCTVTKFRKKKLKRGRTYYVRICAVVKIGNSTYRTPMKDSVQGYISIY